MTDMKGAKTLLIEDAASNAAAGDAGDVTTIDVDGTPVKLDKLGPMIINSDGTISRITSWDEMSEIERTRTLRVMVKRNLARLKKLDQENKNGSNEERLSALKEA